MLQVCTCVGLHTKKCIVNASAEFRMQIDYSEEKWSVASVPQQGALGIIWRMWIHDLDLYLSSYYFNSNFVAI